MPTSASRRRRALRAATARSAVALTATASLAVGGLATATAFAATPPRLLAGPQSQVTSTGRYTLGGYLTEDGVAVAGDYVTLFRDTGAGLQRLGLTQTNSKGYWAFAEYTPGSIVLRAMASAHLGMPAVWSADTVVHVAQPSLGQRALSEAASRGGDPYQYGAAGPSSFDCSGLTQWVFGQLGYNLPRTAAAQYQAVRHVPQSDVQPGDLVFFTDSSGIYHVGVYAGDNEIWHAPSPGQPVQKSAIWTSDYLIGQVP